MSETNNHGGPNRGQGRKPLSTVEPSRSVAIRLTFSQAQKLKSLGGGKWLREKLDKA